MDKGTMQRRTLTLSMMGALALGSVAWASNDKFKTMDSNGDGMITAAEHAAGAKAMFEEMDANKDGNVTAAEMDAGHGMMRDHADDMHGMKAGEKARSEMAMPGKGMSEKGMHHDMAMSSAEKIATMDTNGDGMLSAAEHDAGAAAMFRKMDTDGNGSLSRKEMDAGHADMMKKQPADKTAAPDSDT